MGVTRAMMNDTCRENAELRSRLQVAESALRLLVQRVSYGLEISDLSYIEGVLNWARNEMLKPLYCAQCHRLLVVPQTLDYVATDSGRVCMPCIDRPISL